MSAKCEHGDKSHAIHYIFHIEAITRATQSLIWWTPWLTNIGWFSEIDNSASAALIPFMQGTIAPYKNYVTQKWILHLL